jgi:hypothetical protein
MYDHVEKKACLIFLEVKIFSPTSTLLIFIELSMKETKNTI